MGASLVDTNSCSSLWLVGFPQSCQQTIPTSHFAGQPAAFHALCHAGSVLEAEGLYPPARPIVNIQRKSVVLPSAVSRLICASAGRGSCCQWGSWRRAAAKAVSRGVCLSACWCWLTGPADQGMSGGVLAIPGGKRH